MNSWNPCLIFKASISVKRWFLFWRSYQTDGVICTNLKFSVTWIVLLPNCWNYMMSTGYWNWFGPLTFFGKIQVTFKLSKFWTFCQVMRYQNWPRNLIQHSGSIQLIIWANACASTLKGMRLLVLLQKFFNQHFTSILNWFITFICVGVQHVRRENDLFFPKSFCCKNETRCEFLLISHISRCHLL